MENGVRRGWGACPWGFRGFLFGLSVAVLSACADSTHTSLTMLESEIQALVDSAGQEVAVYYRDLADDDSLLLNADLRMHAASTMKVPVMIQLYQDRADGLLSLDDSLEVRTTFASIVDGSPYELTPDSDSDSTLYNLSGEKVTYRHLIELMITVSSNLATNILIEEVGAERVTASMRALGADSIQVLRGVEDGPAFRAGLSNTTTARDLGVILSALGREEVVSPEASREMVEVMSRQQFRSKIPAGVPEDVRVANKTGWITGISHDAALVYPPEAPPFTLVVLTRGFEDPGRAEELAADIARGVYDRHVEKHGQ